MLPRIDLVSSSTSYFGTPAETLDPLIFPGGEAMPMSSWIRSTLLASLFAATEKKFHNPEVWATVWLAGSGASYLWSSQRAPRDLDVLVGVDYVEFRQANPGYQGLTDHEISASLNELWRETLQPKMDNWQGQWEVTFYSNPGASDIRTIHPYAAYNLTTDGWDVEPQRTPAYHTRAGDLQAVRDYQDADKILTRYKHAVDAVRQNRHPIALEQAERTIKESLDQAAAMFESIHGGRHLAFGPGGQGFLDPANYRWQAGKASGVVGALKSLKDYRDARNERQTVETYGVDLPATDVLIRRAAEWRANR